MGVLVFFICWALFAAGVGLLIARIEQRINGLPHRRTTSAVVLSVLLGPIGWIILIMRSNMRFASRFAADQRAQGELARQQLRQNQNPQAMAFPPGAPSAAPIPAQPVPPRSGPVAGWYPDAKGTMRWWDGQVWTQQTATPTN